MDLQAREIWVRGKGGKDRIVRIGHEAARRVDRYLRARARHELAYRRGCGSGPATGGRWTATGSTR